METIETTSFSLKEKSLGFLLGRLLIFVHKYVKDHGNDPACSEMVKEARCLIGRWNAERKIK